MSTDYSNDQIAALQEKAKRHLWLHFTRMSSYDDHLLEILGRIRAIPSVTTTETFVYLKLCKQTYSWGTR